MDRRLKKVKEKQKETNYKPSGAPRAREARKHQKGVEDYLEKTGEDFTQEIDGKILSSFNDTGEETEPKKINVASGFKIDKLKEKQKQEKALKASEKKEMRGEILESSGEETKLGEEIANKMVEMKNEKEKFEIHESAKNNALNSLWNISEENHEVIDKSFHAFGTEYGLYASIPMLCKGENCVYATLYPELHGDLAKPGERCPVEVAIILSRYEGYKEDLNIDPEDAVDMSILRDVIDYDVQIVRAENKVAVEGDFVKDVVVGVSQTGTEIVQEQISQASEYKQKIQAARNKALNLLNSTRKDKAGEKITVNLDPSSYTKELLARANSDVIDVEFEEVDEEEEDFFDGLEIIEDEPYLQTLKGSDE